MLEKCGVLFLYRTIPLPHKWECIPHPRDLRQWIWIIINSDCLRKIKWVMFLVFCKRLTFTCVWIFELEAVIGVRDQFNLEGQSGHTHFWSVLLESAPAAENLAERGELCTFFHLAPTWDPTSHPGKKIIDEQKKKKKTLEFPPNFPPVLPEFGICPNFAPVSYA